MCSSTELTVLPVTVSLMNLLIRQNDHWIFLTFASVKCFCSASLVKLFHFLLPLIAPGSLKHLLNVSES